ncbi:unnamed protein product, partial [Brugia timori]|uniref:Transposase n=1 Tax=Brugia timori TaxID=42155 RepID=A0A0R3QIM2_9BILA
MTATHTATQHVLFGTKQFAMGHSLAPLGRAIFKLEEFSK